jgi:type IV pilus assembly protein PilW
MMRQRGITLVELMIAVALGTLVTLLAVTLLISANASYVAQAEAAAVDDAGRFALAALERAARQTGFTNWEHEGAPGGDTAAHPHIKGLDDASLSSGGRAIDNPRRSAVNGSDILALRFAGSGAGDGDGSATTCAGFSVGAGQEGWSIFYVALSTAGEPELRCKYRGANNWSADALVGGVDSFQVLYGLDTDAVPDGVPNRYLSASAIDALDAALDPGGDTEQARERERLRKTWWKRVSSIKVALVLHGAQPSGPPAASRIFNLFGAAYSGGEGAGDRGASLSLAEIAPELRRRERRAFSSTILLRNAAQ